MGRVKRFYVESEVDVTSIPEVVASWFDVKDWAWSLKDGGTLVPDENDVSAALDEARRVMYTEPIGTLLEIGRLQIVKTASGHDVFMLIGSYE